MGSGGMGTTSAHNPITEANDLDTAAEHDSPLSDFPTDPVEVAAHFWHSARDRLG